MAKIFINIEEARAFHIWENYFLGRPSAEGSVFMQGAFFYISRERIEIEGQVLKTPYGTVLSALDSESKSLFACREFLCGRRLPLGVTAALSEKGIYIFPDGLWTPGEDFAEWKREIDFTMYTVTAEEAGTLYGISGKTVASDCEKGAFKKSEARRSGKNWLITKQAAALRYGGSEPAAPMNPLLLVFTTLEAAELWNRDSGDVRSAASGAGHRAARMGDGDRRKSGRTWLVTRNAMERLYGPPVFEKMREAVRTLV